MFSLHLTFSIPTGDAYMHIFKVNSSKFAQINLFSRNFQFPMLNRISIKQFVCKIYVMTYLVLRMLFAIIIVISLKCAKLFHILLNLNIEIFYFAVNHIFRSILSLSFNSSIEEDLYSIFQFSTCCL